MNAHIHPPKTPSRRLPPWLAGLLSLTIPGLGQVLLGETSRGGGLLFSLAVMALVYWKHRENIGRLARGEEKSWRKDKEDQ